VKNITKSDISRLAIGRKGGAHENADNRATSVVWVVTRWVDIAMPAAVNAKRASMRSIPVEGLAWFAELALAIGPPKACKAGLTLSFGVRICHGHVI